VRPGARVDHVGGSRDCLHGPALLVSVGARAVEGRANEAVLAAMAQAFGVRRVAVSLVGGERSRDKIVELDGDETRIATRLSELLLGEGRNG
jgi:uncharacterized protein